jgi:AcrR family transcriptional regulator
MSNPMRERLLEAATELFYARGLRAVSVDKVIERAGTTKVTFYRHFKSKDDLVVAYLERRAQLERDGIGAAIAQGNGDVDGALRLIAQAIGGLACTPGFRGCPFINAAAEYPDQGPVRDLIATHREWFRETLRQLAEAARLRDPDGVAASLVLLRDAALVGGYLDGQDRVSPAFARTARDLIAAHRG